MRRWIPSTTSTLAAATTSTSRRKLRKAITSSNAVISRRSHSSKASWQSAALAYNNTESDRTCVTHLKKQNCFFSSFSGGDRNFSSTSATRKSGESDLLRQQQQQEQVNDPYPGGRGPGDDVSVRTDSATSPSAQQPRVSSFNDTEQSPQPQQRRRISDIQISEVLKSKYENQYAEPIVAHDATVQEAIRTCIEGGLSGMMVVESTPEMEDKMRGKVVGMVTSRDLLRIVAAGINKYDDGSSGASGGRTGRSANKPSTSDQILGQKIGDHMTPLQQVIYARPNETVGMARTIMAKLGVKCLPVLSSLSDISGQGGGHKVEGLITRRDLSEYGLTVMDRGGKKNYLRDVSSRVGLTPEKTVMGEAPEYLRAHVGVGDRPQPLFVTVGVAELPHPNKAVVPSRLAANGEAAEHSAGGGGEDAHFVVNARLPKATAEEFASAGVRHATYMGVADGVGSWREYGVDPSLFSHSLMGHCQAVLQEASSSTGGNCPDASLPTPTELIAKAYERTVSDNIVGSSTICVGMFDCVRHQLHFSNLGDCGVMVLRHIDSDVAGALKRDRLVKREERTSDLRVTFVSQQQLLSFNHPYQLGWTGEELHPDDGHSFKTPADSSATSLHIRRGDIIIMATDGLFDNVDIDEIIKDALEWEQMNAFVTNGDTQARAERWARGISMAGLSAEKVPDLAQILVAKARERSLDGSVDSPFAILAKENDIMWSGGMPDDCTVIAMHVVGKQENSEE